MDNASAQRVKELIAKNDKIGILVGKNPSLDQMAASLSLFLGIKQLGKTPSIACPSEAIVANSSLVGIDKVKTELTGDGGDLIVSFPYREGEIEKVSYTLENGYLNIVVKATEDGLSFEQQDVLFKRSGGIPGLIFVVGTARLSDLGNLFDAEAMKNTTIINVDNQNDNQGFGDVVLVTPQASSVSELTGSLLDSLQLEIDADIAQNLLSGISQATNNFQNPNTSYMAFAMAGNLMKKGARRSKVEASKQQEGNKSPYGPFTMPQPRQQQSQQAQRPQQPREQKQRPWEQRPQQQPQQQSRQQQPMMQQQQQQSVAPQPMVAPMQQQPMQQPPIQQVERKEEKDDQETPPDWLAPKVYKSSTLI